MARLTAFLVWALAAATAVFWGLRVFSQPLEMPAHAQPVAPVAGSPAAVVRMLAGAPDAPAAPPPASARFRLVGVMAPPEGRSGGVALISVDGKPPRAYRPGATLVDQFVVQQLGPRSARIGPAGADAAFTLELPPLPAPQTGELPRAQGMEGAAPAAPVPAPRPAPPGNAPWPGFQPQPQSQPPQQAQPQPQSQPQPAEQPTEEPPAEEPSHKRPS